MDDKELVWLHGEIKTTPFLFWRCLRREPKPRQNPRLPTASGDWRSMIAWSRTMAMNAAKRARLEAAGFRFGSVEEFLGLTPEENALVEVKLALSAALKQHRQAHHLSQAALARRLQSSQSRVAKMEAGDPGVTIDLLMRALLMTGATREELGKVIASGSKRP